MCNSNHNRPLRRRCTAAAAEPLEPRRLLSTAALPPPELVAEINPGTLDAQPDYSGWVAHTDTTVFWGANDGTTGDAIWCADGSAPAATARRLLGPGTGPGAQFGARTTGGGLLFVQRMDVWPNFHLWRSDGTDAGTFDLGPGGQTMRFFKGQLYFAAPDYKSLWATDGTAANMRQVLALPDGLGPLTVAGDKLVYVSGTTLYTFDGTTQTPLKTNLSVQELFGATGYVLVRLSNQFGLQIINTTTGAQQTLSALQDPHYFQPLSGNRVIFIANNLPWVTDGTTANTRAIRAASGTLQTNGYGAAEINGDLYFGARPQGTVDNELWKVPAGATLSQAVRVADILPGDQGGNPSGFVPFQNRLYFVAYNPPVGVEVFVSDGTAGGTRPLADLEPFETSSSPQGLTVFGDRLLFVAKGSVYGRELYSTDGDTVSVFVDVNRAPSDVRISYDYPLLGNELARSARAGASLLFGADDIASGAGVELWATDGTPAGTRLVKDLIPGPTDSMPAAFVTFGGLAYFTAGTDQNYRTLWRSDGTAGGTVLLSASLVGVRDMTVVGSSLFVTTVTSPAGDGGGLWRWDGQTLTEIRPGGRRLKSMSLGTDVAATYYFVASDGTGAPEVWRSDGTSAGTTLVADLVPGTSFGPQFKAAVAYKGRYVFAALVPETPGVSTADVTLWSTDGTAAGTVKLGFVGSLTSGNPGGDPVRIRVMDGLLYVTAGGLVRSDGTPQGTTLLNFFRDVSGLSVVGSTLFFSAFYYPPGGGDLYGRELWKSDGTPAGTVMVKDIAEGPGPSGNSDPQELTDAGGVLLFSATTVAGGREPWVSDGTPEGTRPLAEMMPGAAASEPIVLGAMGGRVYFTAAAAGHGRELWRAAIASPPALTGAYFDTTAARMQVTLTLAAPLDPVTFQPTDLLLMNATSGAPVPTASITATLSAAGNQITLRFPGYPNGMLPDGNYEVTLTAGSVAGTTGLPPAQPSVASFCVYRGDANGDRTVGAGDFNLLASHFGLTNQTWSTGDFDGDGTVGASDFNLLASRFGTTLAAVAETERLAQSVQVLSPSGAPGVAEQPRLLARRPHAMETPVSRKRSVIRQPAK